MTTRRDALKFAAIGALLESCTSTSRIAVDVVEAPLSELSLKLHAGGVTCAALTAAYLGRIAEIDAAGPILKSVIEVNPDALSDASRLDDERRAGKVRGPLHGIPILVKDNVDTAGRMKTTAGSLAMMDAPIPPDAAIVRRLRSAGALLLGKTNLSEWANLRSTRSSSGWSARGGQTRNPYALDRSPSGSSSGSGAATAASLCAAAIGTETDGSIVSPSTVAALVGIKPTVGLLSGAGIIPISRTQDTAGPMARSVRDAAMLLSALAEGPHAEADYRRYLDSNGLRGARIGVVRGMFGTNPDVNAIAQSSIDMMKRLGAEVIDEVAFPRMDQIWEAELEILLHELKAGMAAYLAARGGPMKTLKDIIDFNEREKTKEMQYFGQEMFLRAWEKGGLDSPVYLEALAKCKQVARVDGIDGICAKHNLDALFTPTEGPAWPIDWINGDHFTSSASTAAAVAGCPHITVPAGDVHGLPIGVSFFGPAWTEGKLIRLAHTFEQERKARRAPRYLSTVSY